MDKQERVTKAMDELAEQHQRHLITNEELVRCVLDKLVREGDEYEHIAATLGIVLAS
jgi:DNA-binding phage protein